MNIDERLPNEEESFLDLYIQYTAKQESPAMFHLWTGITILSAALGRKCFMHRGYYNLYPNLFTILVAGSARCRKSTAIGIGVKLLRDIPTTKVIKGKITPEKFIEELKGAQIAETEEGLIRFTSPNILVHSSELSVFLTKQSYGEPLIHILTDLFDCPDEWSYKTKNKGEVILHDLFITILAATTPTGIAQGIPLSALHEGFASRVLFCFQEDTDRRNAFPELSHEEMEMYIRLKEMLEKRGIMEGEFTLSNESKQWFTAWYDRHMNEEIGDYRLDGMHGRKGDHLLRIALILAGDRAVRIIEPNHLEAALLALDALQQEAPGAFKEIGGDETTPHMSRLKSFMRKHRLIHHSLLLKMMYPVSAVVFKGLIETAIQSGWIKRNEDKSYLYEWVP